MIKKLHLDEDFIEPVMEPNEGMIMAQAEVVQDENVLPVSTMINQMIKGEWDAIDLYNGMISSLESMGNLEAVETVKDIVKEEYIHVGQLEKLLQMNNDSAASIEQGKQEQAMAAGMAPAMGAVEAPVAAEPVAPVQPTVIVVQTESQPDPIQTAAPAEVAPAPVAAPTPIDNPTSLTQADEQPATTDLETPNMVLSGEENKPAVDTDSEGNKEVEEEKETDSEGSAF